MTEVLLATANQHKLEEFNAILSHKLIIKSLVEFPDIPEIEETGSTLEENAEIKAATLLNYTLKATMADDSGLIVPSLGGRPGVHSARYAGIHGDDAANRKLLLEKMTKAIDRSAYFECIIAWARLNEKVIFFSGKLHGHIGFEEKGNNGFGYDSIFIPIGYNITLAQLMPNEKNAISHRRKAIDKLMQFIDS